MKPLFTFLLFGCLVARVQANERWQSLANSNTLELKILEPVQSPTNAPLPVILYLKNLAAPRTGTDSDSAIIKDFRRAGYLVATLDYAHHPRACVPFLNRDLGKLRDDIRAKKLLASFQLDPAHIFIVPSGCRLKRDVLYYADTNRPLSLDIVYPSRPRQPVGALIEFSCDNVSRMGNTSLSICSDTILDAAVTEGFAGAMADHPVAPLPATPRFGRRQQRVGHLLVVLELEEAEHAPARVVVAVVAVIDLGGDPPDHATAPPGQEVLGAAMGEERVELAGQELVALELERRNPRRPGVQTKGQVNELPQVREPLDDSYLDRHSAEP